MKMNRLSQSRAWAVLLMMVLAASSALGQSGQERNGPIICEDMRGRRSPAGGPDCPWYTGSVVVGLGEAGEFEIPYVEDPDIFYDPYDVWDGICRHWEILDSNGQPAELGYYHEDATAHQEEDGRIWGTCYMKCGPMKRGTYTIICTMDDCRLPGDPARDDPVVKQMTMDVRCEFRINQIFSTDGLNTDGGSPSAGLVGVDVEWTAGCPPWLIASHMCDYLYAPQSVPEICWITMSEERPVDFPHRGKYYFHSAFSPATYWLHNSDDESNWTLTVGPHPGCYFQPNDWEECKVEQEFELHNLSVEDVSPEYLTYDPEAGSGTTITYKLNDAYEICPEAQQTDVYLTMNSSNGQFIRSESFLQTAGRERTYTYTWDGTDWEGNQCPKGIYTYYITAYQHALIPDPTIPENYFTHAEQDMDKSFWSLGTNAEIVACNESTGASTVRVSFVVDPGIMPEGANWKIDHAKLEVFDPDLLQIASAQVGESPVAQTVYFPDLNIDFDKGGTYVFLVSAWDRLYKDRVPISRTHESKPLLQQNSRIYRQTRHILIDPGHGDGSGSTGTHGCWYDSVPPGETPNTNRYSWDEKEYVLELGLLMRDSLEERHSTPCDEGIVGTYLSRIGPWGMTLDERVEWADDIKKRYKDGDFRFISLHANGIANDYTRRDDFIAWRKDSDFAVASTVWGTLNANRDILMWYGMAYHEYLVLTCDMPAAYAESVMLTNPDEEDWVKWDSDPSHIRILADTLSDGIMASF